MKRVKANSSLQAMIQGNRAAAGMWEQADDEVRMLLNIWAGMEPADREGAIKLIEAGRKLHNSSKGLEAISF